jgi:hypothetical protein
MRIGLRNKWDGKGIWRGGREIWHETNKRKEGR